MRLLGLLRATCALGNVAHMTSIFNSAGRVPELNTLPLRCHVSRETAGLSQGDLADAMDSSRTTVSNYERGTTTPRRQTLRLWAMATGVDPHWLMTGEAPSPDGDGASECARRDSNPKPSDLYVADVLTCEFGRGAVAAVSSPGGLVA